MGFANNRIAKIWEIKIKDKWAEVKLTTSKKDATEPSGYKQDFSSYVRFVGKAFDKVKNLEGTEMIKILETDVQNHYDKEKKVSYYNCAVFDFELYESKNQNDDTPNIPTQNDGDDDPLPFL